MRSQLTCGSGVCTVPANRWVWGVRSQLTCGSGVCTVPAIGGSGLHEWSQLTGGSGYV